MIIGLTGGIASGKSTASEYFRNMKIPIVDADIIARDAVKKNTIGLKKIVDIFGSEILDEDGNLDRKSLREIVFNDKDALKSLNDILHPVINEMILKQLDSYKKSEEIIVLDAALLLENKLDKIVDYIVVISTEENIQIERIIKRDNVSEDNAKKIIDKQMSLSEKEKLADIVVYNNSDIHNLYSQLDKIIEEIKTK